MSRQKKSDPRNRANLANALSWGMGGILYLAATYFVDTGIFKVFGYLFLLIACMYLIRFLNGQNHKN